MAKATDSQTILGRLGALVAGFSAEQVTPKALQQARTCILDTIGVTLAGADEPCTRILKETPASPMRRARRC